MSPSILISTARLWMALALVSIGFAGAACAESGMDATPRIGILIPVGPPDYAVIFDAFKLEREEVDGPFKFQTGTIHGVATVLNIAPTDGPLARSLAAQEMLHHFNVKVFVYPGTSGGHLPASEMQVGDVVLGAKNVNFSNFFMARDGRMEASEFKGVQRELTHYENFYADPVLLGYLACSASKVAAATELPAWINTQPGGANPRLHPEIFYYGIQGTSTMWLANHAFIDRTMEVFHEIDEDGDWYSNFVATLYKVPFIEVSVIANNVYEFAETDRGLPEPPAGVKVKANVIAQRLSNKIAIDLIGRYGAAMLMGHYTTPIEDPFAVGVYKTPKNPQNLLTAAGCR